MYVGAVARRIPLFMTLIVLSSCAVEDTVTDGETDTVMQAEDTSEARSSDTPMASLSGLLANPYDWEFVPPEQDPFSPEAAGGCDPEAYGPEELTGLWVYSIETETCSWLTVRQQTALAIQPGDRLRARVFHFALTAPVNATAHIGLAWSDSVFVTADEPIPSEGRLVTLDYIAEHSRPAGTELFFHIDNHGSNSWHLLELRLNPVDDEP